MPNTSATGGYIQPTGSLPDEDATLADGIQMLVVGITGLDGSLVRPRWQPVPPKQPESNIDWCAVGVLSQSSEANVSLRHNADGLGSTTSFETQMLEIMASFYGPNSGGNANLLRAGLMIAQNREALFLKDMALSGIPDKSVRMPEMVSQTWVDRSDLAFMIRRKITRIWPIENMDSADITVNNNHFGVTP
jgi:hypothetical protein